MLRARAQRAWLPAVVHNVPVLRRTPGRVVFRAEGTGTAEPAAIFQIRQPRGPAVRTRRRAVQWDDLPCGPAHRAGAVRGVGLAQVVGTGGHGSCPHPTDAVSLAGAFAGQAEGAAGFLFGREDSHRLFDPALAFHAGNALMDTMPATLPGRAVEGANLYEVTHIRHSIPVPAARYATTRYSPCAASPASRTAAHPGKPRRERCRS